MRIKVQDQLFDSVHNSIMNKSNNITTTMNTICTRKKNTIGNLIEATDLELETEYEKTDLTENRKKQSERSSEDITVKWEFADLGNEKEPIYFVPPNIIYCNISNDLYRFAMHKNRNYGPTWIRMLPYLARIAVSISSESARLNADQLNTRIDEATRYFLRQKKIL
jgi:hypothetical protein